MDSVEELATDATDAAGATALRRSADADPLAEVSAFAGHRRVRLPPEYAAAAVQKYFAWKHLSGRAHVLEEAPPTIAEHLTDETWAVIIRDMSAGARAYALANFAIYSKCIVLPDGGYAWVFPKYQLTVSAPECSSLLRALEQAKPRRTAPDGTPLPWVPLRPRIKRLHASESATSELEEREFIQDDVVSSAEVASAEVASPAGADLVRVLELLAKAAGFEGGTRLSVARAERDCHGFVAGRIQVDAAHRPRQIRITLCPNADAAEIYGTLAHEIAHACAKSGDHGERFKAALVELASSVWGEEYFGEARTRCSESYREVDRWVVSGIRAQLAGASPPAAQAIDDGQAARIVSRIQKLRALAAAHPGDPEAITATGRANDLITIYDLGDYELEIDAEISDEMVDKYVLIEKGSVWKRALAHDVAEFCNVFSLSSAKEARMHFFGKFADIVAAEYLYGVAKESIERACERHLEEHKRMYPHRSSGDTRRERTSFCDTAVWAFGEKLEAIKQEEQLRAARDPSSPEARAGALVEQDLARAEAFARCEHEKRGSSWSSEGSKNVRFSPEGHAAGMAIQVVRGVEGAPVIRRELPDRT